MRKAVAFAFFAVVSLGWQEPARGQMAFTDVRTTEEGAIRLAWQSITNGIYQVQFADSLTAPVSWGVLKDLYPSHGTNTFILDTGNYYRTPYVLHPAKSSARFYRIVNIGTNLVSATFASVQAPTNGFVAFGNLSITVTASTDQAALGTRLYVDGEEMPRADSETNYTSNGTNFLTSTFVINSCEWPNGSHTLFAVVECQSGLAGPMDGALISVGHAVSEYVPVTFSNLITRYSWTEPFYQPSLGQTQTVSAKFAANADWTLQVLDRSSNAVRTSTGSGVAMAFDFDGKDDGGTNLPAGVYSYLLSAQTNGGTLLESFDLSAGGSSALLSSIETESHGESWYPRSAREALAVGSDTYWITPPPMPPVRTNGVWVPWEDVYGSHPLIEMHVPTSIQSIGTGSPASFGSLLSGVSGASFGGAATQSTVGPTRPPTARMVNIIGSYAVAYQSYLDPSMAILPPSMQTPFDGAPFPPGHRVQLGGSNSTFIYITSLPQSGGQSANFEYEMSRGAWKSAFSAHDGNLKVSDLRGSSTVFNSANIGVLMLHGTFGTSVDYFANQCKQLYFPIWSATLSPGGGSSVQSDWLRMSEMNFGSASTTGLKWMLIDACCSLRSQNVDSMAGSGVFPFNDNLHFMLGADTITYTDPALEGNWARFMVKSNLTVWNSWVLAGQGAFKSVPPSTVIRFAWWGHGDNLSDGIQDILGGTSGDVDHAGAQVHP
jgi:hypothetical protein